MSNIQGFIIGPVHVQAQLSVEGHVHCDLSSHLMVSLENPLAALQRGSSQLSLAAFHRLIFSVPKSHNEGNTISLWICQFGGEKAFGTIPERLSQCNMFELDQELLDQQSTKQHWTRRTSEQMVLPPYLISAVLQISRYFKRTRSKCKMERSIYDPWSTKSNCRVPRMLATGSHTYKISARVALLCHCRLHCWCNVRSLAQSTASYASLEAHLQHGSCPCASFHSSFVSVQTI